MIKSIAVIALLALVIVSLASCAHNNIGITGTVYNDADKYTAGSLAYSSSDINRVEVNWLSGSVEIKQGEGELSVSEVNDNLSEEEQLHWMISDKTLYIQFCKSGHSFNSLSKKELHLEIPRGAEINIGTTSADIFADELDVKKADVGTVSGNIKIGIFSGEELNFNTTSGDLNADSLECVTLDVNTLSGNTKIGGIKAEKAEFGSTSGNVTLSLLEPAEIEVKTVSGNTRLNLNGIGAEIELSGVSSRFISNLEYTKNGNRYTIGASQTKVRMQSTSGDMYVG